MDKYRWNNPFLGTVLAGVFTEGSLEQLRSLGFQVLDFPNDSLVQAFQLEGIDIAFDEETPDEIFKQTTHQIEIASQDWKSWIRSQLVTLNQTAIDGFFLAFRQRSGRFVARVVVILLFGRMNEFTTIEAALQFIDSPRIHEGSGEFRKYEIHVEYSNGDKVEVFLEAKEKGKEFLNFVARQ